MYSAIILYPAGAHAATFFVLFFDLQVEQPYLSEYKFGLAKPAVRKPFQPGLGPVSATKGLAAAVDALAEVLSKSI